MKMGPTRFRSRAEGRGPRLPCTKSRHHASPLRGRPLRQHYRVGKSLFRVPKGRAVRGPRADWYGAMTARSSALTTSLRSV